MVYGADAVLPAGVRHNAPRVSAYNEADSNKALEDVVDLLDKARDTSLARIVVYQQGLRNYHARQFRSRTFIVGDLVIRLKQEKHGKLASPWEGPYIIGEVIGNGEYKWKDKKMGNFYKNPWNVSQLRRLYA
jgi:hypothetical protein